MKVNIFNFENVVKLFNKGKIDDVYSKIYTEAERLAIHEVHQHQAEKQFDEMLGKKEAMDNWFKYKRKRIEYHTNKMIELLKMSQEKSEKKED